MVKRRIEPIELAAETAEVSPAPVASKMVAVKFIGSERAVLGERLILSGETRTVSRAVFEVAKQKRPGQFIDVNAPAPVEKKDEPTDPLISQG